MQEGVKNIYSPLYHILQVQTAKNMKKVHWHLRFSHVSKLQQLRVQNVPASRVSHSPNIHTLISLCYINVCTKTTRYVRDSRKEEVSSKLLDSLVKHEKNTQLPVLENKQFFLIAQLLLLRKFSLYDREIFWDVMGCRFDVIFWRKLGSC